MATLRELLIDFSRKTRELSDLLDVRDALVKVNPAFQDNPYDAGISAVTHRVTSLEGLLENTFRKAVQQALVDSAVLTLRGTAGP